MEGGIFALSVELLLTTDVTTPQQGDRD